LIVEQIRPVRIKDGVLDRQIGAPELE